MRADAYICDCCGGKVNRATMTCEYCGTQYKEDFVQDRLIRIETFRNPVREFKTKFRLSEDMIKHLPPKEVSEIAVRHLTSELAQIIAPYCEYHSYQALDTCNRYIDAQIKIIEPRDSESYWNDDMNEAMMRIYPRDNI